MSMVESLMPQARRNSETEVQEVCCHFMVDYNSSFINANVQKIELKTELILRRSN